MKKNIFPARSQSVQDFFSDAPSLDKVLIVPLDYAKKSHTVQFCRGTGELLLKKAFTVYNTPVGLEYFHNRIDKIIKRYHVKREHVLIVSEEPPSYLLNFIHSSRMNKFLWARVNPCEAKKYRDTLRASSDIIDLTGIAGAAINRRAVMVESFDRLYSNLKQAARARRKLVITETAFKNRIHDSVDLLFPGFLSEGNSGLVPFSDASLWLMEENFSPVKIKRMRLETLVKNLRKLRVYKPEEKAVHLKNFASTVFEAPPELTRYRQKSLGSKIEMLRQVQKAVLLEESEMARYLVQTPAFYITSIPGVGVVLAGHIIAELGNPEHWLPTPNLLSYAGVVPRTKQTGGKDQAPSRGVLPYDCNHILKDYLIQAAMHVGTTQQKSLQRVGCDTAHTLYTYYQQVLNRDGHSRIATAKKLMKIMRRLINEQRIYLPEEWLDPSHSVSSEENLAYHRAMIKTLKLKWGKYDLSEIPDKTNQLLKEVSAITELTAFIKSK